MSPAPGAVLRWIGLNAACAAAYFALGKLGLLLALPPGYVSAIWPAAGLAFAVTLVWGASVVPGVFLGSLLTNMTIGGGFAWSPLALCIAAGSALQAWVGGRWLALRIPDLAIDRPQRVLDYARISMLSCLVAATVGNLALLGFGPLSVSHVPQSFLTWWLGDTFGVQIFAPLTLLVLGRGGTWRARRWRMGLPIVAAFILCAITYAMVRVGEERQLESRLQASTAALVQRLKQADQLTGHAMRQLRSQYQVRRQLPGSEFEEIAREILGAFPALRGISWAHLRGERLAIERIVPLQGNEQALGLDLLAEPERAAAARKAMDRGDLVVTRPVRLAQDPDGPGGVLLMVPLNVPEGGGVISSVFSLRVINDALRQMGAHWVLQDMEAGFADAPVILASDGHAAPMPAFATPGHVDNQGVYIQEDFRIADRHWRIQIHRPHGLFAGEAGSASLLIMFFAFAAASIFSSFMLLISGDQARVQTEVALKTAALANEVRDRRRAERALVEKEALLAEVIENSGLIIFVKDRAGVYVLGNRRWEESNGWTRAEALGKTDADLFSEATAQQFRANDLEVMAGGKAAQREETIVAPDGTVRHFLVTKFPLRDAGGEVSGVCGMTTEITEIKNNEAELERARDAANEANLAKSQFLATMSHEIRTPMNGILGMAQLLMMDAIDDAERKDYVRTILGSGQALMTILNDILDLSKVEAGRLELQSVPFDPAVIADETLALFRETARNKGLTMRADLPAERLRVVGDPLRLRQMLSNLLGNAIKFSEHGEIVVRVQEHAGGEALAWLEFSVADQGIGIAQEKQGALFQPFSQVDGSATRRFGGTGLGLSIVRRLAQLMGGDVGVDSREGFGSRFWFSIKAGRCPDAVDVRLGRRDGALAQTPAPGARWILVAEDIATNRLVVTSLLARLGLEVRCAANGQEALELLTAHHDDPPGAVLMDCQMPVIDGYAATQAIRERERHDDDRHVYIIALTADAFAEDRERCAAVGMDDFLAKPLVFEALASALRRAGVLPPA